MRFIVEPYTHNEVQLRQDNNLDNQAEGVKVTVNGVDMVHSYARLNTMANGLIELRIENDDFRPLFINVPANTTLNIPITLEVFRPHGFQDWRSSPYLSRLLVTGYVVK